MKVSCNGRSEFGIGRREYWGLLVLLILQMTTWRIDGAQAQPGVPRAGRNFSFGIIEGPDLLIVGDSSLSPSHLSLTVLSPHDGCGVYLSPSGAAGEFTFAANQATTLDLPYNLMQTHDLGKTKKGILVHTSQPVNLVLIDSMPEAGDATQIYPDEALDTSYVVGEWGLWNDPLDQENNRVEFLVTASQDNTIVTITPTVRTMLGQPAGVPFTTTLMRGESYIVKADSTSLPLVTSLSGSLVSATKPVSVIAGTTCAYVEIGVQSCNEVMDESIGKKWWGSDFFVQPLGNLDNMVEVVMSCDKQFFASINGSLSGSANNRLWAEFFGPAEIKAFDVNGTPIPVEMVQLTRGSTYASSGESDPTMVTILPQSFYSDTMLWNAPHIVEPDLSGFANWAPIIYPTAAFDKILLDGQPLSSIPVAKLFGGQSQILSPTMSAINPSVDEGVHTLVSPVPIFALATGFQSADAYSFIPGTTAASVPQITAHHTIVLTPEAAMACSDFGVNASLDTPMALNEFVSSLLISIRYDPTTISLVGFEPHAVLTQGTYHVDSTTPGIIKVSVVGLPLVGRDLFRIVFAGSRTAASTTIGANSNVEACGDAIETDVINPISFAVVRSTDSLHRALALRVSPAKICSPLSIAILTDSIIGVNDNFIPLRVEVLFDTSLIYFVQSKPSVLFDNLRIKETGQTTGDYRLTVTAPVAVAGSDTVLALTMIPHASSDSAAVVAKIFYLLCGDTVERDLTLNAPIAANIDSSHTSLDIATSSVSFGNPASVDLTLAGLPQSAVVTQFQLLVTYDPVVLRFLAAELSGTLTSGWKFDTASIAPNIMRVTFTSSGGPLGTNGLLTHLNFKTYVADSSSSPITVTSSLPGFTSGCIVEYISPTISTLFLGKDLCGDPTLRQFMALNELIINRASQTPDGALGVDFLAGQSEDVSLALLNTLGEVLWSGSAHLNPGLQTLLLPIGNGVGSGGYILRAEAGRVVASRKLVIVR